MNKQSGNALWFILIAIGLLGLLTVSLSRSGSGTNDTGSFEQNQIIASEILTYAKSIENAVQSLLARGCSENEISFENSVVAGYENPNSPTDKSCHVFDVAGAGMTYEAPKEKWLDKSKNSEPSFQELVITGLARVDTIGGSLCGGVQCAELLFYIPYLKQEICSSLNQYLNLNVDLSSDEGIQDLGPSAPDFFVGDFTNDKGFIGNQEAALIGENSGCLYRGFRNNFAFYHVLHAR